MQLFTHQRKRCIASSLPTLRGAGYLAGEAPVTASPDDPDGRLKIVNVPSRGRVVVMDRRSLRRMASVLSQPDGTWRVDHVDPGSHYLVVGLDDRMQHNAAVQDWILPAALPADPPAFQLRARFGRIEEGVPYKGKVFPVYGTGAVTLALASTLPAGLSFDSATGWVTGTPTAGGDYTLTFEAEDSLGATAAITVRLYMPTERVGMTWSQSSTYGSFAATNTNMRDANPSGAVATMAGTGGGAEESITADLGVPTLVSRVVVGGGSNPGWGGISSYLNGKRIEVSIDGVSWTQVGIVNGVADSGTLDKAIDFGAVTTRYVRLVGNGYLATATFRVYG